MIDDTDFGDVLIEGNPKGIRGGRVDGDVVKPPTPRYVRTGAKSEVLAYQCAIRLLRGESYVSIESSLQARGVDNTEAILQRACDMALMDRDRE